MSGERCRAERVEVDGEPVEVIVRGTGPMTDEDRKHLVELVRALKRPGVIDQFGADR